MGLVACPAIARHRWRDRWQAKPAACRSGWQRIGARDGDTPGESRLRAKYAQVDNGTEERSPLPLREASAEQRGAQTASGPLMLLVAGLFAGSALISLSVLWFAVRGIQWLLHG